MAAGALSPIVRWQATYNGVAVPGAKLYTYLSGTNTPKPVYNSSTIDPGNARTNPVVADAGGLFPVMYLDAVAYRFVMTDSAGATIMPAQDGVYDFAQVQLAASGGSGLVGFIQDGVGAVARTAQAKMREWVSVEDFYDAATTTDTQAITAAIASGAREIRFTRAKYDMAGNTITITRPLTLVGELTASDNGVPNSPQGTQINDGGFVFSTSTASEARVTHLCFQKVNTAGMTALRFDHAPRCVVEDVRIHSYDVGIDLDTVFVDEMRRVLIYGCTTAGILLHADTAPTAVHNFWDVWVSNCGVAVSTDDVWNWNSVGCTYEFSTGTREVLLKGAAQVSFVNCRFERTSASYAVETGTSTLGTDAADNVVMLACSSTSYGTSTIRGKFIRSAFIGCAFISVSDEFDFTSGSDSVLVQGCTGSVATKSNVNGLAIMDDAGLDLTLGDVTLTSGRLNVVSHTSNTQALLNSATAQNRGTLEVRGSPTLYPTSMNIGASGRGIEMMTTDFNSATNTGSKLEISGTSQTGNIDLIIQLLTSGVSVGGTILRLVASGSSGYVDCPAYRVGGTAGASFSGAVTNITVVNGIVTAAS